MIAASTSRDRRMAEITAGAQRNAPDGALSRGSYPVATPTFIEERPRLFVMLKSLSIVVLLAVVSCGDNHDENLPPVLATSSFNIHIAENGTAMIDANAFDPQGREVTYSNTPAQHGTVTLSSTIFTYAANLHYNGTDQFTIILRDTVGNEAHVPVMITITPVDDAPVAQDLQVTFNQGQSTTTELLALDIDSTSLTYTVVTPPEHGTLTGTMPALTYTPDRLFFGVDSFTFKANDGQLDSQLGVVTLTINRVVTCGGALVETGSACVDGDGNSDTATEPPE